LRLLDAHRPAAPTLPQRPFADRALQADNVPHVAAGGAAETAERIERLADTAAGVDLGTRKIIEPDPANIKRICRPTFSILLGWRQRAGSASWLRLLETALLVFFPAAAGAGVVPPDFPLVSQERCVEQRTFVEAQPRLQLIV
jgi:hypothetical protein